MKYLKNNFSSEQMPNITKNVELDKDYNIKKIFFSNNDCYILAIGSNELIIIDSRSASIKFKCRLPKGIRQHDHSNEDSSCKNVEEIL